MYHYKSCGLDNVQLKNGYTERNTKYGTAVSIMDLEGLHRHLALEICKAPRHITPQEFKFLRVELDLPQRRLGSLIGHTDGQSVAKYEKGTRAIPLTIDASLRALYLESLNLESKVGKLLEEIVEVDNDIDQLEREKKALELELAENGKWQEAEAA